MTTLVSIATIPGREKALTQAVDSLKGQAKVVVYDGSVVGDAAKFNGHREHEAEYYFCCDDDIIYPSDYVERMIEYVEQYKRLAVMTTAGKRFIPPVTSYYRGSSAKFHGLSTIASDEVVDVPGTGSLVWHRDTITFPASAFHDKNMGDIWAGVHCRKMGVPCIVVAHASDWLAISPHIDHFKDTIWAWDHLNDSVHARIINENWT